MRYYSILKIGINSFMEGNIGPHLSLQSSLALALGPSSLMVLIRSSKPVL